MEQLPRQRNRTVSNKSSDRPKKVSNFIRLLQIQVSVCVLVFLCVVGFKLTVGNNYAAIKTGAFDTNYRLTNLYDFNTKLDNLARENKFIAFILGRKYEEIAKDVSEENSEKEKLVEDEDTMVVTTTNTIDNRMSANIELETIDAKTPSIFIIEPEIFEVDNSNVLKIPKTETKKHSLPEKIYVPTDNVITSPFGERTDPINFKKSFHTGVDLRAPLDTEIHSIMSGTIEEVGESRVFGNYIVVKHKKGFSSFYAHLSNVLVSKGDMVKANKVIALSGTTGRSTGPHLHFELRYDDKYTNPCLYLDLKEK
ncbi:MAG: peptidoglycan DD-metalloendopeptidase family protein [Clostridia bacterium]